MKNGGEGGVTNSLYPLQEKRTGREKKIIRILREKKKNGFLVSVYFIVFAYIFFFFLYTKKSLF